MIWARIRDSMMGTGDVMNDYYVCTFHGILKRFICHQLFAITTDELSSMLISALFLAKFVTVIHLVAEFLAQQMS